MSIPDKVQSVIARAVARQKELDGLVDAPTMELIVDNSEIVIAELEAELVEVAHNLATTRDRLREWSVDVGEALSLTDGILEENEKLKAIMGIAQAHLKVGQNVPDNSGYIAAALEMLHTVSRKT